MTMLAFLLAPLLSLAAQDPTATAPAAPAPAARRAPAPAAPAPKPAPNDPARWLPASTLASCVIAPRAADPAFAALLDSPEAQALRAIVERTLAALARDAGVDPSLATGVLRNGCALGCLGLDRKGRPDLLLVADAGADAGQVASAIARLPATPDGTLHLLSAGGPTLYLTAVGTRFAAGTVADSVGVAMARASGATKTDTGTLASETDYVASQANGSGSNVAHLFVRVGVLCRQVLDHLPPQAATPARRLADVLGLGTMDWACGSWNLADEQLVARYEVTMPAGNGLLETLAGKPGSLDAGLARLVPSSARGFGFYAVNLGDVFEQVLALVTAIEPSATQPFEQARARIESRTGIDAQAALLRGLNGRVVTLALPGEHTGEVGALLELEQGASFAKALARVLPALPLPLQSGTCGGVPCWRVVGGPDAGSAPALAVVGNWLAIASTDAVMTQLVHQVQDPQPNVQANTFLRSLTPDCTWASFGPAADLWGPWLDELRTAIGEVGPRRLVLRRHEHGFAVEETVAARDLLRIAAAVAGAAETRLTGVAGAHPPRAGGAGANAGVDPETVALLRQAEDLGPTDSSVTAMVNLLQHANPKVAARAAWLLGEWRARTAVQELGAAATGYPDPAVRVQAMAALGRIVDPEIAPAATTATSDQDRRVRTLAVQALGRLGPKIATDPTLALLDHYGSQLPQEMPSDLVAALIVLHDLGDPNQLLPAATAVGFAHPQVGQALAFLFQGLSPRLSPKDEAATLLAVLDHPDPTLRRYAIQRLGELRDPATAPALEGRLAAEGPDLQPLVRVSLAQVRGDERHTDDDLVDRARNNVAAIAEMVRTRWQQLGDKARLIVLGGAGALLLLLGAVLAVRRRARRAAAAIAAAALVEPSADFEDAESLPSTTVRDDFAGAGVGEAEERF